MMSDPNTPNDAQPREDAGQEPHAAQSADPEALEQRVINILKQIYDPEIPVNIYDLGLIYGLEVNEQGDVSIHMTLTSPACPVAGSLPPAIERLVGALDGVNSVKLELVWDPPWSKERLSDAARLQLGL